MTTYGFVYLEYGQQRRDRSMQVLGRLRRALLQAGDDARLIVVDNAASDAAPALTATYGFDDVRAVAGDNANREFTGWDLGIQRFVEAHGEPDVWLFANDTLAFSHAWSNQRVTRHARELGRLGRHAGPWLFGEINDFPRSTLTPLGPLLEWVATYCFAMNRALRERLPRLSPDCALLDTWVRDRFEPGRGLFSDAVDAAYADFVSAWLVNDDGDRTRRQRFKWSREWHKVGPLTADNFDDLRMKARCCLSESLLSLRARQLGAEIRSPYDARSARDHLAKSWQLVTDKLSERYLLRRAQRDVSMPMRRG